MDSIEEVKRCVLQKIMESTEKVIEDLSQLWFELYESNIVEENVQILESHVKILYQDITNETVQRKEDVLKDVERLRQEADDLRRLLHVDLDLRQAEGVPIHTFKVQLNFSLEDLRKQLKDRQDEIEELLVQQNEICSELEETPRNLGYDPLPTADEIADFRHHLNEMVEERDRRSSEFRDLRVEIRSMLNVLELEVLCGEDQKLVHGKTYQLSKTNQMRLRHLKDKFNSRVADLNREIDNVKEKVYQLWKCLEVDEEIMGDIERHVEYNRTTYDVWRQEKDRCETERRQNLKKFIDKMRQELLIMWEKTLKSDEEKRRFKYFTSDIYNDDLLRIHEMELEDLNKYYNDNAKIFELVAERRLLWGQMKALEEKANAPNRFNNRGGQLLREEKERKTIAHKLPKIENDLRELVQEYETLHKKKFTIYGRCVEDVIEEEWEKKKSEKQKFLSARKAPLATTTPGRKPSTPMPTRIGNLTAAKQLVNTTSVSTALKRKMATTVDFNNQAKRNILGDLNSPRPKTPGKPNKSTKTIATIHQAAKRRSSGRKPRATPHKRQPMEKGLSQDSVMSYDTFQEIITNSDHCRSSIIARPQANNLNKQKTPSKIIKGKIPVTTTPYKRNTRMMLKRLSENEDALATVAKNVTGVGIKSPGASTSRISPGKSKLQTKDLPIIF